LAAAALPENFSLLVVEFARQGGVRFGSKPHRRLRTLFRVNHGVFGPHIGPNPAWAAAIHRDSSLFEARRQVRSEAIEGCLEQAIAHHVAIRPCQLPRLQRHVHDPTAGTQQWRQMLDHRQRTEQIAVEDLLDHVERVSSNDLGIAVNTYKKNAGVVHQHVKRAVGLLCPHGASCRTVVLCGVEPMTRCNQPVIA
jgi:hypothetical protein